MRTWHCQSALSILHKWMDPPDQGMLVSSLVAHLMHLAFYTQDMTLLPTRHENSIHKT